MAQANILKLIKKQDLALKTALNTKLHNGKFNILRNNELQRLRKAKADFFINIISKAKSHEKMIWEQMKKLTRQHHKIGSQTELEINGNLSRDSVRTAEAFNHYFIN